MLTGNEHLKEEKQQKHEIQMCVCVNIIQLCLSKLLFQVKCIVSLLNSKEVTILCNKNTWMFQLPLPVLKNNMKMCMFSPPLRVPWGSKMSPPRVTVLVITCLSKATFFALSRVSHTSVEPNTYSMAFRRSDS